MQKTKLEIIEETIEHYKNNPRSVNADGHCMYNGNDGAKCAFGRCCTDEGIYALREGESVQEEFLEHLKPEYQGHNEFFWGAIQMLHDGSDFWEKTQTGNILTDRGIDAYNDMKKAY